VNEYEELTSNRVRTNVKFYQVDGQNDKAETPSIASELLTTHCQDHHLYREEESAFHEKHGTTCSLVFAR
jgi:hypothetical protein